MWKSLSKAGFYWSHLAHVQSHTHLKLFVEFFCGFTKKNNQSPGTKASKKKTSFNHLFYSSFFLLKYLPCSSCSPSYLLSLSMHWQKHLVCDSLHLKPTGKPMGERVWPLSLLHVHRILESDKQSQNLSHRILRPVCALRLLIQPRKVFTRSALLRAPGMMFV